MTETSPHRPAKPHVLNSYQLEDVATPEVLKRVRKLTSAGGQRRVQETQVMQELAQFLDKASITLAARVTPAGRYYGAITSSHIAEQLSATLGRSIKHRLVENMDPIREPGKYDVGARLGGWRCTVGTAGGKPGSVGRKGPRRGTGPCSS